MKGKLSALQGLSMTLLSLGKRSLLIHSPLHDIRERAPNLVQVSPDPRSDPRDRENHRDLYLLLNGELPQC